MAIEKKKLWKFRVYTTKSKQVTGGWLVSPPKKMNKTEFKAYIKLYFKGRRSMFWEFVK